MKKLSKSSILKYAFVLVALMFTQLATFAGNPEVYASQANLSNLSLKEVTEQTWVWVLIGGVVVVAITALFTVQTVENHETAAH
jgi:hypothetical protein